MKCLFKLKQNETKKLHFRILSHYLQQWQSSFGPVVTVSWMVINESSVHLLLHAAIFYRLFDLAHWWQLLSTGGSAICSCCGATQQSTWDIMGCWHKWWNPNPLTPTQRIDLKPQKVNTHHAGNIFFLWLLLFSLYWQFCFWCMS